ncbi:MAG: DUF5053 domain-containing protein [Muribaculaceae bacterium]|nr:DUF5053 domain-containing protein [Muribaculaceae bacterium]
MSDKIISIRKIEGAEILDTLNCAAISERFFNRSRAWFIQRLNNNIVNGKPVSFTPEELLKLRTSLKVLASEITQFTTNIPNLPTDMSIKVYVITDPEAINYLVNDDIDGFTEYLASDDMLDIPDPEYFDTEAEALAFCSGIGYGENERTMPERYPLRSCEETDIPFIEAIENY